jgi:hypothetical protein
MEFDDGIDFTEQEVVEALVRFAALNGVQGIPKAANLKRVGLGRNIRAETGCSVGLRPIKSKQAEK